MERGRNLSTGLQESRDAWIVLDPVITVHPDEIFFECFSQDDRLTGAVRDHDTFKRIGDISYGTTNIDYSHALYDEFQRFAATALRRSP